MHLHLCVKVVSSWQQQQQMELSHGRQLSLFLLSLADEAVILPGSPLQHHLGQVVWLLPHSAAEVYSDRSAWCWTADTAGKALGFAG